MHRRNIEIYVQHGVCWCQAYMACFSICTKLAFANAPFLNPYSWLIFQRSVNCILSFQQLVSPLFWKTKQVFSNKFLVRRKVNPCPLQDSVTKHIEISMALEQNIWEGSTNFDSCNILHGFWSDISCFVVALCSLLLTCSHLLSFAF